MIEIEKTSKWGAYEAYFQAKAKRHAESKMTDEKAIVKGQRFFVDVAGPMKNSSLGENSYVVTFVNNCTRSKVVKFFKEKYDTAAALLSLIADYITTQKLSIKRVRKDSGGEFEGENFSANWVGAASRTSIPFQTRRGNTRWLNVRLEF